MSSEVKSLTMINSMTVAPQSFVKSTYQHRWLINLEPEVLWRVLNRTETFKVSGSGPYHVEFLDESGAPTERFEKNILTNHYGPFLNAAGVIGEINHLKYRDLQYNYGSFVFSFGLVRPQRLEFFYNAETRELRMEFSCFIKPWFQSIWQMGMKFFWPGFEKKLLSEAAKG